MKEILRTERLLLRETEAADIDGVYAMVSDPLVMAHYPRTRTLEESRQWIEWVRDRYQEFGFCFWTVTRLGSEEFFGQCGILVQEVDGARELEVAYLFCRSAWHQGYATEAARACRDYAFDRLGRDHVISLIRPANLPSRAVAERNGMTIWKTTTFRGHEALVYRIARAARDAGVAPTEGSATPQTKP